MYTRALLFKRYSRLAALYSILEIGRQPSLGGRGFALADAQASSDAMMTTATGKLFWRNEMSASIFLQSATATPPTPPAAPSTATRNDGPREKRPGAVACPFFASACDVFRMTAQLLLNLRGRAVKACVIYLKKSCRCRYPAPIGAKPARYSDRLL
jgi:hypothetical protein